MALKPVIDTLEGLSPALREHYVAKDGKYQVVFDGDHPDIAAATAKVAEFRDTNITLTKKVATFDGIDPVAVAADRARLAELEKAKPHERITALETELAAEKTARTEALKRADALVIENAITDVFGKTGGRPEARAFVVAQAAGQFVVENGQVKGTKFSPDRAGEPMSVTEWITLQTRKNPFCFFGSSGGGADPRAGGGTGGGKTLKNPTPQELGRYAKEIANGDIKLVYE